MPAGETRHRPRLFCPDCRQPFVVTGAEPILFCPECGSRVAITQRGTQAGELPYGIDRDMSGQRLGDYQLDEVLGAGGMSVVYRATRAEDGAQVAVKVLSPQLAVDPEFAHRLAQEAGALRRLEHPHIIRVLDQGEEAGHCFVVLDFHPGRNLRDTLAGGRLPPMDALRVFREVAAGLSHAHRMGVVHRDIKPANLLLTPVGVKILDFGIARLVHGESGLTGHTRFTRTSAILGTLQYMAPEQLRDPRHVDHRADLFSLGVVLYEMLTGRVPVGSFAPPSAHCPRLPAGVDALVGALLRPDPQDRPATVDAALAMLAPPARPWVPWVGRASAGAGTTLAFSGVLMAAASFWSPLGPDVDPPIVSVPTSVSLRQGPGGVPGSTDADWTVDARRRGWWSPDEVARSTDRARRGAFEPGGYPFEPVAPPPAGARPGLLAVRDTPWAGVRHFGPRRPSGAAAAAPVSAGSTPPPEAPGPDSLAPTEAPSPATLASGAAVPANLLVPRPVPDDVRGLLDGPRSSTRPVTTALSSDGARVKLSLRAWTDTNGNQWQSPHYEEQGHRRVAGVLPESGLDQVRIVDNQVIAGSPGEDPKPGQVPDKQTLKLQAPGPTSPR